LFGVTRTSLGGLLLALGLVMLWLFTFVVSLPSGLEFIASLTLGVVPAVAGVALLWAGWRSSGKSGDPEAIRVAGVKEQIVWRAVAQGGRITAAEAAAHVGQPEMQIEHALMSLVAEGRAAAEPGAGGEIVYRIDSPL
jgi:cadmium resistance protein CadD (predicted permease)